MLFTEDCSKALENKDLVEKSLDVLTPQQRAVVESYYLDEKPIADIAKEQGVCVNAIEKVLIRARLRLRAFGQSIQ